MRQLPWPARPPAGPGVRVPHERPQGPRKPEPDWEALSSPREWWEVAARLEASVGAADRIGQEAEGMRTGHGELLIEAGTPL